MRGKIPKQKQARQAKLKPPPNFQLITELQARGYKKIIGVDEVGRGALAGPLVVAAVELPIQVSGVHDSKLINRIHRQTIAEQVHGAARQLQFGLVTAKEIDEVGLAAALKLAYERALHALEADIILTDFVRLPGRKFISQPQGDRYFYPVAAASIVAKVYRDQLMQVYHHAHTGYGWAQNVGYGTAGHRAAIAQLGATTVHRRSFLTK